MKFNKLCGEILVVKSTTHKASETLSCVKIYLRTSGAAGFRAMHIFSSTYFDEIIIFELSKDQTFRIWSTFMNPEQFLILVLYLNIILLFLGDYFMMIMRVLTIREWYNFHWSFLGKFGSFKFIMKLMTFFTYKAKKCFN
jgi:hypothetical protein